MILGAMAYDTRDARQLLLDTVAEAAVELGKAIAALGAAYDQLDELTADRLEAELFRPAQLAYGRAQRTHAGFAERHGLPTATFPPASAGAPSHGVRGFIDAAVDEVAEADLILAELQDSMMLVEVGDAELRSGLADVREVIADFRERARELVRTLGR
jgi:hypothetical protein